MIIAHMKSGKSHKLKLDFPSFEDLNRDKSTDAIAAEDLLDETVVHILPKVNIESIEIFWSGTLEELKEASKEFE